MGTMTSRAPLPTVYTVDEVAQVMRVHPRTVYRLIAAEKLRAVRFGAGWRIPQAEVDAVLRGER